MTYSLFNLSRKIALVTGSSQKIGFGIARGLGQAGAMLILNGRNGEKLNRAVSKDDSKNNRSERGDLNDLFSSHLDHFIEASAIVYEVLPGYIRMDMVIDMGNITSRSKHERNL
jgi:NAD(P)-dependent dehydrogenase (short-subunit alcohol dehydrogenase family)